MEKLALFAFNGDALCFIHVLLNAIDMKENGHEVKIIMEGSATRLVPEMAQEGNPLFLLYQKAKEQSLIDGACKACSSKMKVAEAVANEGVPFLDEMSGHPSMKRYLDNGYRIIVF